MRRKTLIIIVTILILVVGIQILYLNSNYYYSKKLVSAIREEDIIAVQQIIEKKPTCINTYPSITSKGWHSAMNWRVYYPLNEAVITGNVSLIELLIENGADVNCNDGFTPLSIAYLSKSNNWYDLSLFLIKEGASLDYTTEHTGTSSAILEDIVYKPPFAPPEREYTNEVMSAFLYALENCDHSKIDWMRVLQHSVTNDRIEIVKLLLDQGYCTVNDTTDTGRITALMFAARDSTPEMVQLLLDYGADKNYKNSNGMTAYDYAVKHNKLDNAELLKQ